MKGKNYFLILLFVYIVAVYYYAVLSRDAEAKSFVRLDLFQGYVKPINDSYRDVITNLVLFMPLGFLVGLSLKKYRVILSFLIGAVVSLAIETSQLVWHRGTFDVDDLFNNTVGAVIGGLFTMVVYRMIRSKQLGSING